MIRVKRWMLFFLYHADHLLVEYVTMVI
ncbi:hypothetical protein LINPERHAP1_LOCUS33549 [Linum perenne]